MEKKVKKEVPKAVRRYEKELMKEMNADGEAHGKKPFSDDDTKPPETKQTTESTTDPERRMTE